MAFKLKLKIRQSNDGRSFDVYDTTGVYSPTLNPTGYGTPNPDTLDIATSELTIYFPEATIPTIIDSYPTLPNKVGLPFTIGFDDLNLIELPDGIYQVQHKVTGTLLAVPFTYAQTTQALFTHKATCCVNKMLAALDESSCSCCDDKVEKVLLAFSLLEAAKKAACCGQIENAKKLLKKVNDICTKASQGCGC